METISPDELMKLLAAHNARAEPIIPDGWSKPNGYKLLGPRGTKKVVSVYPNGSVDGADVKFWLDVIAVDVAQKAVTQQSPRLMPVRTFYGSTYNNWAGQLLSPNGHSYLLTEGQRQLGNFILPKFQRQPCWTMEQKTKLINSIYRGNPIGGGIAYGGTPHDPR